MSTEPKLSGADAALRALREARAAAKKTGNAGRTPTRRRRTMVRGNGRDPLRCGGILEQLAVAYQWQRPSAGGQVMVQWPQIAGPAATLGTPERFDADTRTLHVRPVSPAAATKLRWEATALAATLNGHVGEGAIGHIRILPPGPARPVPGALEDDTRPTAERRAELPVKTRADGSRGYQHAMRVLDDLQQRLAAERTPDARQALADHYFAATRGSLREPDPAPAEVSDGGESGGNTGEAVRQAAIQRARAERAGRTPEPRTAFDHTA